MGSPADLVPTWSSDSAWLGSYERLLPNIKFEIDVILLSRMDVFVSPARPGIFNRAAGGGLIIHWSDNWETGDLELQAHRPRLSYQPRHNNPCLNSHV